MSRSRSLSLDQRSTAISIVPAAPRFMSTALAMYRSGVPIVWALAETASAVATTNAAAAAEAKRSSRAIVDPLAVSVYKVRAGKSPPKGGHYERQRRVRSVRL